MLKPVTVSGFVIKVAQDVPAVVTLEVGNNMDNSWVTKGDELAYIIDDDLMVQTPDGAEVSIPLSALVAAIQVYGTVKGVHVG